jgi:molybdate transport system regulatory protein
MKLNTAHLHEALGHGASDKRLDILRRIGEVGSISQAARDAGVSYKAAWQAVETLSNLAGSPMLEKAVGGSGGGGARLTPAGEQLLATAQRLQQARSAVVAQLDAVTSSPDGAALQGLALRTSMRNTLPCTVAALKSVEGATQVRLRLPDGQTLISRITRESAQLLGLRKSLPVLALCKATAVTVSRESPANSQTTNRLLGHVQRLPAAGRAGEVSLRLGGDQYLVGFAATGHGLRKGDAAQAVVDMSAVVVGLG